MFGLGRKPLKLVSFAKVKPETFGELLCDGVTAHNLRSFTDLIALHSRLCREHPNHRVLASLDNLGQACYTSGHSADAFGLDDTEGHDLSALGDELFEDGEHLGYLSTPAEFPIRLSNLLTRSRDVDFGQLAGVLEWRTCGDANDLVSINRDVEQALQIRREKEVLFQFVPVSSAADTIAAFPNGYFSVDLDPIQNHALARHLEAQYGFALFGIGSKFLGFCRKEALDEITAHVLATELAVLYAGTPQNAVTELARLIAGRNWILLRYTES